MHTAIRLLICTLFIVVPTIAAYAHYVDGNNWESGASLVAATLAVIGTTLFIRRERRS